MIDLAAVGGARVSHAHCPPSPWTIAEDGATVVASEMYDANALRHRRTAAWVVNASSGAGCAALAVGAAGTRGLKFLDVSPSPTARHWVHGVTAEDVDADESAEAARMEREMFSEMEEKKLAGGGNAMDAELAMDAGASTSTRRTRTVVAGRSDRALGARVRGRRAPERAGDDRRGVVGVDVSPRAPVKYTF